MTMNSDDSGDILADLDFDLSNDTEEETEDFSKFTPAELVKRYNAVRRELLDTGQMLRASTPEGRELHSQRVALIVMLRSKGIT